ncbi:MAG: hypothetical protein C0404_05820 [Verrucomicrobia bacterium]|nr:hypothetical protein [Verrucomicrobiota bacterium]
MQPDWCAGMIDTSTAGNISIGLAGWSYPDWTGYVYPKGLKDYLGFIAPYFDCIEINSTFYRPPEARLAAGWAKKVEELSGFFFTAKLHQDVTHKGEILPEMVGAFRDGLGPLSSQGRLRHLLAQFSYAFTDSPANRDHLSRIRDGFSDIANLTLELRHASWQADHAAEFLRSLQASVANLDYPVGSQSYKPWITGIGEHSYLRLHGRNSEKWFSKGAGRDEVYNYLYGAEEVKQIANRAAEIATMSKSLTLIANNHYQGKEAVNALQIKALITGGKVAVPPLLLERYPQLKEIAR